LARGEAGAGRALVGDPRVATIAFTGSGAVGLEIVKAAAEVAPGQLQLKRTVIEMGGKNCVIVDADADLDDAVPAIVRSAFDYAGQKCSAAARVLVHEAIADALAERVAGAVQTLRVGQADDFATDVPPVIEGEAQDRVRRYAALAAEQGTVIGAVEAIPDAGWFCAPCVAIDLPSDSPVLSDEIFGPVLAVERVRDIDEALDRVNGLRYA